MKHELGEQFLQGISERALPLLVSEHSSPLNIYGAHSKCHPCARHQGWG